MRARERRREQSGEQTCRPHFPLNESIGRANTRAIVSRALLARRQQREDALLAARFSLDRARRRPHNTKTLTPAMKYEARITPASARRDKERDCSRWLPASTQVGAPITRRVVSATDRPSIDFCSRRTRTRTQPNQPNQTRTQTNRSPNRRVALHYRDLPATSDFLTDCIIETANASRRVILLLSERFLRT